MNSSSHWSSSWGKRKCVNRNSVAFQLLLRQVTQNMMPNSRWMKCQQDQCSGGHPCLKRISWQLINSCCDISWINPKCKPHQPEVKVPLANMNVKPLCQSRYCPGVEKTLRILRCHWKKVRISRVNGICPPPWMSVYDLMALHPKVVFIHFRRK